MRPDHRRRRFGEQFELTSSYVEMVWSEFLGPTTTLLAARRIGLFLAGPQTGADLSIVETGNSLGVAPSRVRWSLTRLAGFELIAVSLGPAAVVTSGLVVPVPTRSHGEPEPCRAGGAPPELNQRLFAP